MVLFQRVEVLAEVAEPPHAQRLLELAAGRRMASRQLLTRQLTSLQDPVPLVALHGISRNAAAMWQAFAPLAKAQGRALLVPRSDDR